MAGPHKSQYKDVRGRLVCTTQPESVETPHRSKCATFWRAHESLLAVYPAAVDAPRRHSRCVPWPAKSLFILQLLRSCHRLSGQPHCAWRVRAWVYPRTLLDNGAGSPTLTQQKVPQLVVVRLVLGIVLGVRRRLVSGILEIPV